MTRTDILTAIEMAEREARSASRAFALLGQIVRRLIEINGDSASPSGGEDLSQHLLDLARTPKPLLKAWAAACCHDPVLGNLIAARKRYARADRTRGKGTRDLDVTVSLTFQAAAAVGFKGTKKQWEGLLRLRV